MPPLAILAALAAVVGTSAPAPPAPQGVGDAAKPDVAKTAVRQGIRLTLARDGKVVAVLTLPKEGDFSLSIRSRQVRIAFDPAPGPKPSGAARTTTYRGDVAVEVVQNGTTIATLTGDEATVVASAE